MEFIFQGGDEKAVYSVEKGQEKDGICTFLVKMSFPEKMSPAPVRLLFRVPGADMYSVWSPGMKMERYLGPNWKKRTTASRLASGLPVHSLLSLGGKNRLTVALSDAKTPIEIASGVCEEDGYMDLRITFFTVPIAPVEAYSAILRLDLRENTWYDSIYDVTRWWEEECGYTPAEVPAAARLPMYSTWYNYHQNLDPEELLAECVLAKELGMDTILLDDGWQTEDSARGYRYCGDWKVSAGRMGDMAAFVEKLHGLGMKVILWYAVPFMGAGAESYERFKDMLLDAPGSRKDYWALDPRYPQVRAYLADIYEKAVRDWKLDGLKLDFINQFKLEGRSLLPDPRRDYTSLEDGVDALMTEVYARCKAVNPEIMIEFRQPYVGPAIRKYGNMLRVGDCPADPITNKMDVADLRFTSGKTAVHSDMVMWSEEERAENAALQLYSVLYSVPQISVKLRALNPSQRAALKEFLAFWRKRREMLLDGKLCATHPESGYGLLWTERDGEAIFTAYGERVIDCGDFRQVIALNLSGAESLLIKNAAGRKYTVLDCLGNVLEAGTVGEILAEIPVPLCGRIEL